MTKKYQPNVKVYVAGFALSMLMTLAAYALAWQYVISAGSSFTKQFVVFGIVAFALVQLLVQLVLFLHLGREPRPRWNLNVFIFMLLVVVTLVFGSLWIMENLNYHSIKGQKAGDYIMREEKIQQ